jgi:hypothetical protein
VEQELVRIRARGAARDRSTEWFVAVLRLDRSAVVGQRDGAADLVGEKRHIARGVFAAEPHVSQYVSLCAIEFLDQPVGAVLELRRGPIDILGDPRK